MLRPPPQKKLGHVASSRKTMSRTVETLWVWQVFVVFVVSSWQDLHFARRHGTCLSAKFRLPRTSQLRLGFLGAIWIHWRTPRALGEYTRMGWLGCSFGWTDGHCTPRNPWVFFDFCRMGALWHCKWYSIHWVGEHGGTAARDHEYKPSGLRALNSWRNDKHDFLLLAMLYPKPTPPAVGPCRATNPGKMRQNSCSFLRSVAISLNLELESGYPKATPHLGGRTSLWTSPMGTWKSWNEALMYFDVLGVTVLLFDALLLLVILVILVAKQLEACPSLVPRTATHPSTTQSKMPNHLPLHRNVQSFVNLSQNRANADTYDQRQTENQVHWTQGSGDGLMFVSDVSVVDAYFWMAWSGVVRVRILWLEHARTVVWCNPHHQPIRGKLHSSQGCPRLPASQCPNHTAQPAVIGFAASSPRDPRRFYRLHLAAWLGPRCRKLGNAEQKGNKKKNERPSRIDHEKIQMDTVWLWWYLIHLMAYWCVLHAAEHVSNRPNCGGTYPLITYYTKYTQIMARHDRL